MKELQNILTVLAAGLKSFSESIQTALAVIAELQGEEKTTVFASSAKAEAATGKPASGKKRGRKAGSGTRKSSGSRGRVKKDSSAANYVLKLIGQMPEGANAAILMEKTGYDKKKVANILYRLKAKKLINNEKMGVYTKI